MTKQKTPNPRADVNNPNNPAYQFDKANTAKQIVQSQEEKVKSERQDKLIDFMIDRPELFNDLGE